MPDCAVSFTVTLFGIKVVPVGIGSVIEIFVAEMLPLFGTVMVYVMMSPIFTICWFAVFEGVIIVALICVSTILLVEFLLIGGWFGGLY
ncbi:hypothetical protein bthur0005_33180 [Bacillus thuringiensis serovar pakistani str. T13001]|nr:hypothetical protein bthur0005_33180 [Bacillus thuringiensis serovar pakistani str. T13001]